MTCLIKTTLYINAIGQKNFNVGFRIWLHYLMLYARLKINDYSFVNIVVIKESYTCKNHNFDV